MTTTSSEAVRNGSSRSAAQAAKEEAESAELQAQIIQLQNDIKGIAATLAGMAESKVSDAQRLAKAEARNLAKSGQQAVEAVEDEFEQIEQQIKDSIRARPLTAVIGAAAVGYLLAALSR
jgi:hypothetical protein